VFQNDQIFDLSTYPTVGDLVTAINAMPNLTAQINSTGRLEIAGQNNYRVAINELTSNVSAAGDLNKGFSDFFGLNNFYSSAETFARYRSDLSTSSTSAVVTTAGTIQFTAAGVDEDVSYNANDSLTALASAINGNTNLQTAGITAQVVADGDGFRLQVNQADGDEFAMVETAGGSALGDTNLRADNRGLSNRLSVRSDIQSNSFFISRGTLQSNTFESSGTTIANPALPLSTAGYGVSTGGNLTFTIDASTTATIAYATTDSLNDVATAINSNATLNAANIHAEVVVSGTQYSLKITDGDADDFWVADSQPTTGLGVDNSQGVSVGDGSVAADMAAAFNSTVTFLAAPASGGGLSRTDATFTDYAAGILAFSSAQTDAVERDRSFQQSLRDELFNKNASVSGVNMDEELSNLIIYEQAYLAASRMITTTNELFKALTQMLG
jgi:flagellar hook-associated protein 1 FlgK